MDLRLYEFYERRHIALLALSASRGVYNLDSLISTQ